MAFLERGTEAGEDYQQKCNYVINLLMALKEVMRYGLVQLARSRSRNMQLSRSDFQVVRGWDDYKPGGCATSQDAAQGQVLIAWR